MRRNSPGHTQRTPKVKKWEKTDTDTEDDDEDDEDEEMPKTTGIPIYDTSEREGRYIPKQTIPKDDAVQIHSNGEISGENVEPKTAFKPKC